MSEKRKIATREGFGKEIVALGKENPDILVVDIDIGKSCKTGDFRKELPQQYLNVGIAEQNGAGLAAGLATCGKVPYLWSPTPCSAPCAMCEHDPHRQVCYPNLNVKIACYPRRRDPRQPTAPPTSVHRGSWACMRHHPQHDRDHCRRRL